MSDIGAPKKVRLYGKNGNKLVAWYDQLTEYVQISASLSRRIDTAFFKRFPNRRYRMRLASYFENWLYCTECTIEPAKKLFVIVKYHPHTPAEFSGDRFLDRHFVQNFEFAETDISELEAHDIWEILETRAKKALNERQREWREREAKMNQKIGEQRVLHRRKR